MDRTVRELVPETSVDDLEAFVAAYLSIWNHPDNLPFLSFTGLEFEESAVREWGSNHLSRGVRYFGALDAEGTVVGMLVTSASPITGFELRGLGVRHDEKRKGSGLALVRRCVETARSDGYPVVTVTVYATNAPMLRLLLGEGFVPARMEHHLGPSGEDLLHLQKHT